MISSDASGPFCCLVSRSGCLRSDTGLEACQKLCSRRSSPPTLVRIPTRLGTLLEDSCGKGFSPPPKPFPGILKTSASVSSPLGSSSH